MFPKWWLFIILALLSYETAGSLALGQAPAGATWMTNFNPLSQRTPHTRRDSKQTLEKRQGQGDGTAFDRNPDGSAFLWVLRDTYEGETFFE